MSQKTGSEIVGTVNHMKKNGTFFVVIFGLIAGLILLIMGGGSFFDGEEENNDVNADIGNTDALEYKTETENEIKSLCMQLSGVSDAFVCVRVNSGGEKIYATNTQSINGADREEYVIIGSGSNAEPLYLGQKLPEICGIGVILKGNNISSYKNQLEAMLSAAYSIPLTKVYVQIN